MFFFLPYFDNVLCIFTKIQYGKTEIRRFSASGLETREQIKLAKYNSTAFKR